MNLISDDLGEAATILAGWFLTGVASQKDVDDFLTATRDDDRAHGTHLARWQGLVTAVGNRDLYHLGELSAVAVCGHGNPVIAEESVQLAVWKAAARFAGDVD